MGGLPGDADPSVEVSAALGQDRWTGGRAAFGLVFLRPELVSSGRACAMGTSMCQREAACVNGAGMCQRSRHVPTERACAIGAGMCHGHEHVSTGVGMCQRSRHVSTASACAIGVGMCYRSRHVPTERACVIGAGMCHRGGRCQRSRHVSTEGACLRSQHVSTAPACVIGAGMCHGKRACVNGVGMCYRSRQVSSESRQVRGFVRPVFRRSPRRARVADGRRSCRAGASAHGATGAVRIDRPRVVAAAVGGPAQVADTRRFSGISRAAGGGRRG